MIERLLGRLANVIAYGRLKRTDVAGTVQTAQVDFSRHQLLQDDVPLLQQFGFGSRPPAESDVVAVIANGEPKNAVIVASGSQAHRPPTGLVEGDSVFYDARGNYAWLTPAGFRIKAPQTQVDGNFEATGDGRIKSLVVGNGATGTFTTPTGQTVEVRDGIVTNIF